MRKISLSLKKIFIKPGLRLLVNSVILLALLGVYIYSVFCEGFSWPYFWACIGLIAGIGLLLNLNIRLKGVPGIIVMLLLPPASFYLMEAYSNNGFAINGLLQGLNILFYFILFGLLFLITGRGKIAGILGCALPMVVGIANYYTICFRSSPILPWDLLSLRTAMSVTSNYEFAVEYRMLVVALGFAALIALASKLDIRLPKVNVKGLCIRVGGSILCVAAVYLMFVGLQLDSFKSFLGLEQTLFTPTYLYKTNGFAVSFIYDLQFMEIEKPQGYSLDRVKEIMEPYMEADVEADAQENSQPNIIVIMNEAFSDLSVLGDFETNVDYMPFTRSLEENTVKGNLLVSVKGGNTANTEFEFLTGDTLAFLPQGSVAYQQYVNGEMPSLASYMGSLGYLTYGMHPYYASGWDRDEVYPFFGFDYSMFINDFEHREILRKYVSDRSAFAQIIDLYEQKAEDERIFAFEVTMQNHGGYYEDFDNFIPDVTLEFDAASEKTQHYTELYLSLIKESDAAFEALVNYFKAQDEETVIVMFGDHQPADIICSPILKLHNKDSEATVESQQERYTVPFVIWANYDIEEKEIPYLSTNYLSSVILDTAGVELTGYQRFLLELSEKVPVATANVYMDAQGNYYNSMENPYKEELLQYQMLQYYHLVEKDKSMAEFFGGMPEIH